MTIKSRERNELAFIEPRADRPTRRSGEGRVNEYQAKQQISDLYWSPPGLLQVITKASLNQVFL